MTIMTLRRAAQVYNRITAETQFEQEQQEDDPYGYRRPRRGPKKQSLVTSATVSVDGEPRERADLLRKELLAKKDKIFRLMAIGTQIRTAVGAKQATCGVSALVTERVAVVQQQKVLDALLKSVEVDVYEPMSIVRRAVALRDRLSVAGQGQTNADITTPLLTLEDRDTLRKELAGVKRRQLEIDDKLAELNSTNTINVLGEGSADIELLRDLGIA